MIKLDYHKVQKWAAYDWNMIITKLENEQLTTKRWSKDDHFKMKNDLWMIYECLESNQFPFELWF